MHIGNIRSFPLGKIDLTLLHGTRRLRAYNRGRTDGDVSS